MPIEDVKQLKTVNHQGPAQKLLDEGWTLLAVCVKQDGTDQYAEYHLGKAAEHITTEPPGPGVGMLVGKARIKQ